MLSAELAREIVKETMDRVNRNINIMDRTGTIIASGEESRIGQYHAAAAEAVRTKSVVIVDEAGVLRYEGVQVGINLPVYAQDRVIGVIGISGQPEQVEPLGQLLRMTTELMIRQNQLKLKEEWRQFTVDLILEDLIHGSLEDPSIVDERLRALRLSLAGPFLAAVVSYRLPNVESQAAGLIARVSKAIGSDRVLIGNYRPQKLALLFHRVGEASPDATLTKLAEWMQGEGIACRIGLGNRAAARKDIRASYEEADMALRYAASERAAIARFDDIEARAIASLIPEEHRDRLRQKIVHSWNGKTKETLTRFFQTDLSIAGAAEALGIHRNTMIYRLEQFKQSTGYDPQKFEHALLLQLAIWWHSEEA